MTDNLRTHDYSGNYPVVLGREMVFETLKEFFWGPFSKFTTPKQAPVSKMNRPTPTDSIVAIQWELNKEQGDMIEIPMHRQLKQLPRIGKEQMMGHEEKPYVNFAQIPVMLQRHGELPQDSSMSTQVSKDLRLLENAYPALRAHYARAEEYLGANYAFHYGYSYNVLESGWFTNETKIATYTHPHVFIAGYGKVSYSSGYPGNTAYETEVATRMGGVGASHTFGTKFLQALKADPQVRKIPPIIAKGYGPMRLIVAHPWQIVDLELDETFQKIVSAAMVEKYAKENPYLIGAKYMWAGWAIYESDTASWPARVTSSLPDFGPETVTNLESFESYASDTMFTCLVLGRNALYKAMGSAMGFRKRTDDYGEIIGVAYRIMQGYSLGSFWNRDDGTTGQYLKNDSSALAITYASAPAYT